MGKAEYALTNMEDGSVVLTVVLTKDEADKLQDLAARVGRNIGVVMNPARLIRRYLMTAHLPKPGDYVWRLRHEN